jgi:hypothetical protein
MDTFEGTTDNSEKGFRTTRNNSREKMDFEGSLFDRSTISQKRLRLN